MLKFFEKYHILQNNIKIRIILKLFFSPMQINSHMKFVEILFLNMSMHMHKIIKSDSCRKFLQIRLTHKEFKDKFSQ